MNQDEKEDMARYILDVNQERGVTVVLIEHDMGVVMDISDQVVVLDRGREHRRRHARRGAARPRGDRGLSRHRQERRHAHEPGRSRQDLDAAQAAAAQRRAGSRAAPASARRRAASGRPTAGRPIATRCATSRSGLAALGFRRGDKLSVVGDNRPQLYFAQLSAQALGGISVPVYQDSIASELVYVLNHAETSVDRRRGPGAGRQGPVAQGQAAASCAGSSSTIRAACALYDDPILRSFDERAGGRARRSAQANPGFYEAELAKGGADDIGDDRLYLGHHGHARRA